MSHITVKEHTFDNGDKLELYISEGDFATIGKVIYYAVTYLEKTNDDLSEFYTNNTQYFSLFDLDEAVTAYEERLNSKFPSRASRFTTGAGLDLAKERNEKFLNKAMLHELYGEHKLKFNKKI